MELAVLDNDDVAVGDEVTSAEGEPDCDAVTGAEGELDCDEVQLTVKDADCVCERVIDVDCVDEDDAFTAGVRVLLEVFVVDREVVDVGVNEADGDMLAVSVVLWLCVTRVVLCEAVCDADKTTMPSRARR